MKAAAAIAEILKREGVTFLIGYPVNTILEAAAQADIRTIIVRQERVGLHMADAVSRVTSGQKIGVFAMQHGPGAENSFGGVAQAYGDSVPIVVLPGGYPRRLTNVAPNFNSALNYRHITKWCEQVTLAGEIPNIMRRAFTQVKNGRPRPVLVEVPVDIFQEDVAEPISYTPALRTRATRDAADLAKDIPIDHALIGDAGLILDALIAEVKARLGGRPRGRRAAVTQEIAALKAEWLQQWMPRLTSGATPLSPYRVIWDLMHTVDLASTIITHDAGSPRDQLSPFWETTAPMTYIGWGKTTQLGTGLGYAMGAKLARPDKLCINLWGDAAIGFTGMDFETAVRERIPILSVLLNNFSMAIELKVMKVATEKFRSTDISGNYADMARAFGGHGERVTEPGEIAPAIKRAVRKTEEGVPALLEFITEKAVDFSIFP